MVLGDSRLVIDFAMRRACPGKAYLFLKVMEIQSLVRQIRYGKKCSARFKHIGRELLADWAGNVARELQATADCTQICEGMPLWGLLPCNYKEAAERVTIQQHHMLHHQDP
jgi:hypothetical protein